MHVLSRSDAPPGRVDNDNGVDQSEFNEFLGQMEQNGPPPPAPPSKKKSKQSEKPLTKLEKGQIKSLKDFYKKHGASLVARARRCC